jgi:hypothetical protein
VADELHLLKEKHGNLKEKKKVSEAAVEVKSELIV